MPITAVTFGFSDSQVPAMSAFGLTEYLTPGSVQSTTIVTTADHNIARVVTDTAVWVSVGLSPNASTDTTRHLILAGSELYLNLPRKAGNRVSVMTTA